MPAPHQCSTSASSNSGKHALFDVPGPARKQPTYCTDGSINILCVCLCRRMCGCTFLIVCCQLCLDELIYSTVIKKKTIFRIRYVCTEISFWILQVRAYSRCIFFHIETCGKIRDYSGFGVFFGRVYTFRICFSIGVHTKLGPI